MTAQSGGSISVEHIVKTFLPYTIRTNVSDGIIVLVLDHTVVFLNKPFLPFFTMQRCIVLVFLIAGSLVGGLRIWKRPHAPMLFSRTSRNNGRSIILYILYTASLLIV